jgi:hypothetical protein
MSNEITNLQLKDIEGELLTLGGGMRGFGSEISTIGTDAHSDVSPATYAQVGYLVTALGFYVERLAADMDGCLMEDKQ